MAKDTDLALLAQLLTVNSNNTIVLSDTTNLRGYTGGTVGSTVNSYAKTFVIGGTYNQSYNTGNAVLMHIADYSNDTGDNVYPIYVEDENNLIDFYINAGNTGTVDSKVAYFGGSIGIGNTAPNAKLQVTGTANVSGNVVIGGALTSANLTTTTNTTTIGTAAYFVANGNVGVGTSSPSQKLDVAGIIKASTGFTFGSDENYWYQSATASATLRVGTSTNTSYLGIKGVSGVPVIDGAGGALAFATSGSERARIDSSGNVGIGTASPAWKLHITDAAAPVIQLEETSVGNTLIGQDANSFFIRRGTAGAADAFTIDSSGNIGIGNSTPNAKLQVTGTANVSGNVVIGGIATITGNLIASSTSGISANNLLLQGDGTNAYIRPTNSGSILYLGANNNNLVTVAANGNVGIGTSSPGSALHAYGNGAEIRAENTTTSQYASSRLRLKGPAGTARSSVLVHGNDNVGGTNPYFAIEGHNSSETYIKSMALFYHASDYWYFPYTIRSPIFYDSDDTNSYFEGPQLFMRGGAPTVYFRDTDSNSAMIHCNGNLLYFLRGGNDTTSWTQVNSQWPLYLNLTNNDGVLGGAFYAVGNITAYYSDRRLKTNIKPITGAIDKLKQINGVYYKNNDFAKSVGYTDEDEQVGVISQEVEKVLPHVVKRAPFDIEYDETDRTKIKSKSGEDYKTVQYDRLVPLLIEAIKEQQVEIEKLKAAIAKEV